jgi:hypothetical protein
MLRISIDPAEIQKAMQKLERLSAATDTKLEEMLLREGAQMEREVKESLNIGGRLPGKGPRGGKLTTHSLPGEAPRKQSGRLQSSIGYLLSKIKGAVARAADGRFVSSHAYILDIGAIRKVSAGEVVYAEGLELGTSRVAPRPFLTPVVMRRFETWEKKLAQIFGGLP